MISGERGVDVVDEGLGERFESCIRTGGEDAETDAFGHFLVGLNEIIDYEGI